MRPGGAATRPARPRARSRERLRPRLAGRRDRQRARTARPPRRLPRRCSAPATWHDAPRLAPGLGDERPRPACGRLPIIRASGVSPQPGEPCPHAELSESGSGRIDAVARCATVLPPHRAVPTGDPAARSPASRCRMEGRQAAPSAICAASIWSAWGRE